MTCKWCVRIGQCLADVGLSPDRVMCVEDCPSLDGCRVDKGIGYEGQSLEYVELATDQALKICAEEYFA